MKEGWFRQYRVVPVSMSLLFALLLHDVVNWYMGLPVPTNGQSGFAGAMLTAAAAWFKFYVESGNGET